MDDALAGGEADFKTQRSPREHYCVPPSAQKAATEGYRALRAAQCAPRVPPD